MTVGAPQLFRIALVAFVRVGVLGIPANEAFHLFQCPLKGVTIKRIVVQGFDANNPVFPSLEDQGEANRVINDDWEATVGTGVE